MTAQPRDLLWFQMIHRHGPLSSSYLHEFSKHICRNEKRARDRLTDLFNEDHTPHGGPYLERPWQQFDTFDARYQDLVYELSRTAEKALQEHAGWNLAVQQPAGPWKHRFMVSCITASIELATLADSMLNFIPQEQILARANTGLRYPVPFKNPRTGKIETRDLIPDAVFGIEYNVGRTSSFRFFIVEADRATEPSRSSKFNRKSHLRNILQYREYVGRGLYKDHLKLAAGMMVLNITTSEKTLANMLTLANEVSEQGNTYMLFRTSESFGRYFKPPRLMPELLTGQWQRAGYPTFQIDQP